MTLEDLINDMLSQYDKQIVLDFLICTRYVYSCQFYCYNDLDAIDLAHWLDNKIEELVDKK